MSISIRKDGLELVDQYRVAAAYTVPSGAEYSIPFLIKIMDNGSELEYHVIEKYEGKLLADAEKILSTLVELIRYDEQLFEDPVKYLISFYEEMFIEGVKDNLYFKSLKSVVEYLVIRDIVGYSWLTPLMADEYIEDISLSSPRNPIRIWHRKYSDYGWIRTNIELDSDMANKIISRLAFRVGKGISILEPVLEGILPEKYRVSATWMDEVSPLGSSFTIRKFRRNPLTLEDLVKGGTMTEDVAALIWYLAKQKKFIVIIGPSGSGKTTLLNALLLKLPLNMRIVTLEEVPELNLGFRDGWKPMATRWDRDAEDELFTLLRLVLRERADYIAVGESRGLEVRLVFQAAATGHGCITTFHASTIKELFARLKSKPISVDESMLKLLDAVVVLKSGYSDGRYNRYVDKIYLGNRLGRWFLIYRYGMDRDEFRKRVTKLLGSSELSEIDKLASNLALSRVES